MRYVSGLVRAALFVMVLSIAPCVAGAASSSDAALAKDVERQLMDNKSHCCPVKRLMTTC